MKKARPKFSRHPFIYVFFTISVFLSLIFLILVLNLKVNNTEPGDKVVSNSLRVIQKCKFVRNWRDCYGKELAQINYRVRFSATLNILDKVEELDPKTRDCHLIAHRIALSEVDKSPKNWINIFDYVDQTTCVNGFVHGTLEGRSKYDSNLVLNEKTIPEICSQIEQRISARAEGKKGSDDACAHIMGHILLAQDYAKVDAAVDKCAKLPEPLRVTCYDGVFMENITRENLEAHEVAKSLTLNKATSLELEEDCRKYDGDIGRECWRELPHIYTVIAKNDPNEIYSLCYQNSKKDYARECFMHAINLMILSDNYSHRDLADTCKNYWQDTTQAKNCIFRSVNPLLSSSVDFIDRASDFCSLQPQIYRKFCYTGIGKEIKARTTSEKGASLCSKLPKEFINDCLSAN